jgi:large subunit ribosomal protein L21
MFAVIKAGGKQYRVAPEDVIRIDRVDNEPGQVVAFGEVLMVGGDAAQLGTPTVAGATVAGEVLEPSRRRKPAAKQRPRPERVPRGSAKRSEMIPSRNRCRH